jgi:hypothetical protein
LVATRERDRVSGVEAPAAHGLPGGQLIYTANGRLSVQIVRTQREDLNSYFGRWELVPAEGCIIHYKDANLNATRTEVAEKYGYAFDSRSALLSPPRRLGTRPDAR